MRPGRRGEASTKASSGRETAGLRATVMSCRPSRTVFPCDAHFAGLTDVSSNHVRAEAVRWGAGGQCGPALEGLPLGTLGRPRAGVGLGLVRSCSQGSGGSPRIDAGRGTGPRRVPAAQPRILAAGPWTGVGAFWKDPGRRPLTAADGPVILLIGRARRRAKFWARRMNLDNGFPVGEQGRLAAVLTAAAGPAKIKIAVGRRTLTTE